MVGKGFIFSLDAFVAFTLITMTISLLVFTIGTPKPYYLSLQQAHTLAFDTLQALATSSPTGNSPPSYLEIILSNPYSGETGSIMRKIAGGNSSYYGLIPKGFGYRLESYDFASNTWTSPPIYDSSSDPFSDRFGKNFSKLQASAMIFMSLYPQGMAPVAGEPTYCYISCSGYQPDGSRLSPCDRTPCERPTDTSGAGNNSIQLVRLTVYA